MQKDHRPNAKGYIDHAADLQAFAALEPLETLIFPKRLDSSLGAIASGLGNPPQRLRLVKRVALPAPVAHPNGYADERKHRHDGDYRNHDAKRFYEPM
jgi:hypothetical protein